jgi:phytoene/squalene synthetase
VINHLQDCQDDYRTLDRVYLPLAWMEAEATEVVDLRRNRCTPGMRRVIDRCLDGCEALLAQAAPLPGALRSRRLAMESGAILAIAHRLVARLRRGDPLSGRIQLSKGAFAWCCARGAAAALV